MKSPLHLNQIRNQDSKYTFHLMHRRNQRLKSGFVFNRRRNQNMKSSLHLNYRRIQNSASSYPSSPSSPSPFLATSDLPTSFSNLKISRLHMMIDAPLLVWKLHAGQHSWSTYLRIHNYKAAREKFIKMMYKEPESLSDNSRLTFRLWS